MVVYLHGNASARVEVLPNLSFLLAQLGVFGVVGLDFTGSGKSDGDWVSLGYYERVDLECMLHYLKRVYGGPDGTDLEIILWGRSMGASTALMHAGKKNFTAQNTRNTSNSMLGSEEAAYNNSVAAESAMAATNRNGSSTDVTNPNKNNASILKGLVCDSPFASLTHLCEELVERAREQGVVVPGVVISVAIAMIARSVRKLANFNIREITPIEDVGDITVPALFVVGADDDFISPRHSERLVEAYKTGVTTNLFMVPGGHNDARPRIVFDGIEEFCKQRLSLSKESALVIPEALRPSIHQNPPWAYARTVHFQAHSSRLVRLANNQKNAAESAAEDLGMTKDRQDDIQNKIGLMMGGQTREMDT
jgi:pimeloyl-ACP methyl ester carboxylesterase